MCVWGGGAAGGAGAAAGAVAAAACACDRRWRAQPVRFMEDEVLPLLCEATRALARVVRAAPLDVVFVRNATSAVRGEQWCALNLVLARARVCTVRTQTLRVRAARRSTPLRGPSTCERGARAARRRRCRPPPPPPLGRPPRAAHRVRERAATS